MKNPQAMSDTELNQAISSYETSSKDPSDMSDEELNKDIKNLEQNANAASKEAVKGSV
jgi:hypothetical protein